MVWPTRGVKLTFVEKRGFAPLGRAEPRPPHARARYNAAMRPRIAVHLPQRSPMFLLILVQDDRTFRNPRRLKYENQHHHENNRNGCEDDPGAREERVVSGFIEFVC